MVKFGKVAPVIEVTRDTLVLPVGDEGAELGGAVGDVDGGRVDAGRVGAGT